MSDSRPSGAAAVLQTCLHLLGSRLSAFFTELGSLQLSAALAVLTSAPKGSPFLALHAGLWEELVHPFKLLVECEKRFYEWSFLSVTVSDLSTSSGAETPVDKKKRAAEQQSEDQLKYMYSQVPLGMRKTMAHLQKLMAPYVHAQALASQQAAGGNQRLPPSASMHQLGNFASAGRSASASISPAPAGLADAQHFASMHHLLDELLTGYIPLKITMIQLYQNLNAPYASAARVKEVNWHELSRVCENLATKCEKAFTHPHLVGVKDALLLPELCLLRHACALECEPMLPAHQFTHTMFLLMRVRSEHSRWMNRLLARDRDGTSAPAGASLAGSLTSILGGGRKAQGNHSNSSGVTLNVSIASLTFPSVLHWIHLLHHSLLCKATLLFWPALHAQALEMRGAKEDMQLRMDRLDVNYVGMIDKLVRRLPNCHSFSIVLDQSLCSGSDRIVDPLVPLHLRDSAAITRPEDEDHPPQGGLAKFPLLFSWPHGARVLEKWNMVGTLISKQDLMVSMASVGPSAVLPVPKQTATYLLQVGPSNLKSDLLVWDWENEHLSAAASGHIAPNSVSYFIAKLDPSASNTAYIVITFQSNTAADQSSLAHGNMSRESTGSGSGSGSSSADNLPPTSLASATTPTHSSVLGAPSPSSASASSAAQVSASALPTAASRKRIFDLLLADVTPVLQRLRHMHVFQQMQPGLGKKKS